MRIVRHSCNVILRLVNRLYTACHIVTTRRGDITTQTFILRGHNFVIASVEFTLCSYNSKQISPQLHGRATAFKLVPEWC